MGLSETIAANPLGAFLVVVLFASVLVILSHSKPKIKRNALPFLFGSLFSLGFLYDHNFRAAVLKPFGYSPFIADRLAIGIQQAGANGFLWTPEMTDAFILVFGAAVVATATGSRKLGWLIGLGTVLYLIAKAWAIITPIVQALP